MKTRNPEALDERHAQLHKTEMGIARYIRNYVNRKLIDWENIFVTDDTGLITRNTYTLLMKRQPNPTEAQ